MNTVRFFRASRGYTLLELMIVLGIASIVVVFATPAFTNTLESLRGEQTATDLFTALALARSAAIQHDQYAVVCAEDKNGQCGTHWPDGFMVFIDENNSTTLDSHETVLQHFPAAKAGSTITLKLFTNKDRVTYLPDGRLKHFTAGSFTYCPADKNTRHARHILVNRTGRARMALDRNDNGIGEDSSGKDITCR